MKRSRHKLLAMLCVMPTAAILAGPAAAQTQTESRGHAYFVPHGTGQKFSDAMEQDEVKFSSQQTEGRFTFEDEVWSPTFKTLPHFHKEHSESFFLLDGEMEWTVGGETRVVSAGDSIYVPPNTIHSAHVLGGKSVHIIFISQPGGFEHFQEKMQAYTAQKRSDADVQAAAREIGDIFRASER